MLSVFAALDLGTLELELCSSEELEGGNSSAVEDEDAMYMLELLGFGAALELGLKLELGGLGSGGIPLELESSWSPQKTSNKLSLPSLHPKTAITKATATKNKRIK